MVTMYLLLATSFLCFIFYRLVLYPVYITPLAKIPNAHFTAPTSPLWMLWVRFRGREVRTIHDAHEKLGPVVRLGPNELSVNCIDDGVRIIYGQNFKKHRFYPNLFTANSGVEVLFSEIEHKPHAQRKRLVSNIYSKSVLQNSTTMASIRHEIIRERLMPRIQAATEDDDGKVDMYYLIVGITMDFITAYQFGLCNGSDFTSNGESAQWWIEHFDNMKQRAFWAQELPWIVSGLSALGIRILPATVQRSADILENWCLKMMEDAENNQRRVENDSKPENIPVHLDKLRTGFEQDEKWPYLHSLEKKGVEPWRVMACAELFDNIGGAQEGTTTAIFYIMRELARHPEIQASLRVELHQLSPPNAYTSKEDTLPSPKEIDSLSLLNAIVTETLRLYPPMAGPQPRVTPPDATLGSYSNLPAGVRVSSQPYSLHRNVEVFPDPESWKPYRWLDTSVGEKAEMRKWFWGFSSGAMMCLGSHFALQQAKLVTAALVSNYTISIVDDNNTDPMDAYSAQPCSKHLILKFQVADR